jgi:hypothetical protein
MVSYVIKSNREKEPYQKGKIINSLKRLNIDQQNIDKILLRIDEELPEVISTKKLFQFIFDSLKEIQPSASFKFNIKQAIFKLGPAGYPFEKFVAHLFKLSGYEVQHNIFLPGKCLVYEIDLLAKKDELLYIGECKFHQNTWQINDVKVVLYSYARFLDIQENMPQKVMPMVITNTRFTSEAIKFAECYKIDLLAWDWPQQSLSYLVDFYKAYPLTIFDFLPLKALQKFFDYDIVLIQDVLNKNQNYLKKISGLNEREIEKLILQIKGILEYN